MSVKDLEYNIPPLESYLIVKDFLNDFPHNLSGIPLEWEIDFGIDLLSDMNPI